MSETIRHRLPLLAAGQAQKEVTHNDALLAIDRQLQLSVVSRVVGVPPAVPVPGSTYVVPAGASGAWAGQTDKLAMHDGFGWVFTTPRTGCLAWIEAENGFTVYQNGWTAGGWPVTALRIAGRTVLGVVPVAIAEPVGGAVIDVQSRNTIAQILIALRDQAIIL